MTIAASSRKSGPFTASAGQTAFNYTWPLLAAADILVFRQRGETIDRLTLNTDYVVTGVGEPGGGTVVLTSGATLGDQYVLLGGRAVERTRAFPGWRSASSGQIDDQLDEMQVQIQELARDRDWAIGLSLFDDEAYDARGGRIADVGNPVYAQDAITKAYGDAHYGGAAASEAAASAALAIDAADTVRAVWLGSHPEDPTAGYNGAPLTAGMKYWNSLANEERVYNGSAWLSIPIETSVYVPELATIAALKSLAAAAYNVVVVRGKATATDGYGGLYRWSGANSTTLVAGDPNQWLYVPPDSDTSGASGVWVRWQDGYFAGLTAATLAAQAAEIDELQADALTLAALASEGASRHVICYRTTQSVRVRGAPRVTMSGFRFFGGMKRQSRVTHALPRDYADLGTDRGAGMTSNPGANWMAVFLAANGAGGTPVFRIMPYLRVLTVVGSDVNLAAGGENQHTLVTKSYPWATDALDNTEILLISENMLWSGRVATITANTINQITLDSVGTLAPGDYMLPAPPGYSDYRYIGSFYVEASGADIRNISDDGRRVQSYGIDYGINLDGAHAAWEAINPQGYVCPLAVAGCLRFTASFSTGSEGDYFAKWAHDASSHLVDQFSVLKQTANTISPGSTMIQVTGSQGPLIYFQTAGSLASVASSVKLKFDAWVEP